MDRKSFRRVETFPAKKRNGDFTKEEEDPTHARRAASSRELLNWRS
ncbi:hypothetical protein Pcac1_g4836 [Phytophthora cactorum]|nr:hypothetical protein Pcac1_g4836 [Phytophthora cactorum]